MLVPFYTNDLYCDSTQVPLLEKRFASYVGTKYAVAVDSCTNAIACCLEYFLSIGELTKDSVLEIPDMTYVSVAHEISRRCKLELSDEWYAGHMYQIKGSRIYDSAHEVRPLGLEEQKDNLFCYSFYPTKLVPSYEGGMIATNDAKAVEFLKLYRQMGRTAYGANYDVVMPGLKCNMTPIQAQKALESLEDINFTRSLSKVKTVQYIACGIKPISESDHLFIVQLKLPRQQEMLEMLRLRGIEASVHFRPITEKTCYKGECGPKTEYLKDRILSLPYFPTMTAEQIKYVAEVVRPYL